MLAPNCCIVEKYTVPCSLFLSCDKHAKLDIVGNWEVEELQALRLRVDVWVWSRNQLET